MCNGWLFNAIIGKPAWLASYESVLARHLFGYLLASIIHVWLQ